MLVVPEPSERWTTLTSVLGRVTPGVGGRDRRVVPFRDLAEEEVRDDVGRHLQRCRQPSQVVGHDHRTEGRRDLDRLTVGGRRGDLRVLQEGIGGAEVDRVVGPLLDAAAGADRLVVELDAALGVVVLAHLREQREDEGRAGTVELAVGLGASVGDRRGGCGRSGGVMPRSRPRHSEPRWSGRSLPRCSVPWMRRRSNRRRRRSSPAARARRSGEAW